MSPDDYVLNVLNWHQPTANRLTAQTLANALSWSINQWAGEHLNGINIAGSVAKGTAISGSSDVDILVSLKPSATTDLASIYQSLYDRLRLDNFQPRKQNVSIGATVDGHKVDVVPARRHNYLSTDHSIWSHKTERWRTTNIHQHINVVANSSRLNEIKLLKIWRDMRGLEFPSFPLEVTVITALRGHSYYTPSANFVQVLQFLANSLTSVNIIDPTKPSNILSEELTSAEKQAIARAASISLAQNDWADVIM